MLFNVHLSSLCCGVVRVGADIQVEGREPLVADLWEAPQPWAPDIITAIKASAYAARARPRHYHA